MPETRPAALTAEELAEGQALWDACAADEAFSVGDDFEEWVYSYFDRVLATIEEQEQTIATLKGALEEERRKFQRETLRTSEQAVLLARTEALLSPNHAPGSWARGCRECALVGDIRELLARPIGVERVLARKEAQGELPG